MKKREKLIKNWRPISLFNTDAKLISKALPKRIEKLLSSVISPNQTTHLEKWFLSEGGRLISDIMEVTNTLKNNLALDIKKVFNSVNYLFIFHVLQKLDLGRIL